jgi:hypothetical protein
MGFTAALSAAMVLVILLAGSLFVSPTARAQVQQWIARFVEVDSPIDFMAEQVKEQQANLEAKEDRAGETDDPAASPKDTGSKEEPGTTVAEVPAADTAKVAEPDLPDLEAQPGAGQPAPAGIAAPPVSAQRSNLASLTGLVSLEEAQSRTSFNIRTPTWLPDGYTLQGVVVPPDASIDLSQLPQPAELPQLPTRAVATLSFSNAAGEVLLLSQMQAPQLELPDLPSRVDVPLPVPRDKANVQEISINGQPAQYVEMMAGRQLHWQDSEGFMYDLMSATLDQASLIRIAESVK